MPSERGTKDNTEIGKWGGGRSKKGMEGRGRGGGGVRWNCFVGGEWREKWGRRRRKEEIDFNFLFFRNSRKPQY